MKRVTFLILLSLCVQVLIAENLTESKTDVTASSELTLQVSSIPEMKLAYAKHFNFPFLQGEAPLTKDSNIGLTLTAEITPVSLNGVVETVWTLIAFFQLAVGGRIGSGWNIEIFGSEIYGIGLNSPDAAGNAEHNGQGFDGLLWKIQTGGTLQFDLAALYPGDWHHIVARSYHEINYKSYTRAAAGESWYYENDDGENRNGFNYYGNFLIGYQMPIFFNLAAFLTEVDLFLYNTPDRGKWGDDIIRWTFSGIFNFMITEQIDLTLIAQFKTWRNYQESNWKDLYYRNRTINNSSPLHLEFYRIVASMTYKL
jgi:hypothetical protein